jgi:hypothetical protein
MTALFINRELSVPKRIDDMVVALTAFASASLAYDTKPPRIIFD